jgi:hypothetical protein
MGWLRIQTVDRLWHLISNAEQLAGGVHGEHPPFLEVGMTLQSTCLPAQVKAALKAAGFEVQEAVDLALDSDVRIVIVCPHEDGQHMGCMQHIRCSTWG